MATIIRVPPFPEHYRKRFSSGGRLCVQRSPLIEVLEELRQNRKRNAGLAPPQLTACPFFSLCSTDFEAIQYVFRLRRISGFPSLALQ